MDWCILGLIVIGEHSWPTCSMYGIKQVGASVAGSYIYAQPVFAAAIAMFVLGEELTIQKILAAMCIFARISCQ